MEVEGDQLTGTREKCLICHSNHLGLSSTTSFSDKRSSSSSVLCRHLSAYFLLRHVLELSSEQLEAFLSGSPNPEDWVKICAECRANYVEKCENSFLELVVVKRRFARAKRELIEAIKRSVKSEAVLEHGKRGCEREIPLGFILDIDLETRRFVGKNEYPEEQLPLVSPFIAGDLMATEISEEAQMERKTTFLSSSRTDDEPESINVRPTTSEGMEDSISSSNSDIKEELPSPEEDPNFTSSPQRPSDESVGSMIEEQTSSEDGNDSSEEDWSPDDNDISSEEEKGEESETEKSISAMVKTQSNSVVNCGNTDIVSLPISRNDTGEVSQPQQVNRTDLIQLTCPMCRTVMSSTTVLYKHMSTCTDDRRPRRKCDYCDKEFLQVQSYHNHLGSAHGITDHLKYNCPAEGCSRRFPTKYLLSRHRKHGHKPKVKAPHQNKGFECDICGKLLRTRETLKQHEAIHEREGNNPFECKLCGKSLSRYSHIRRHMNTVHNPVLIKRKLKRASLSIQKKYQQQRERLLRQLRLKCDICSEIFKTSAALRKHQILIHKTNLYECSQCEWKTYGIYEAPLKKHMKRHHGPEKDVKEEFTCPKCQKILYSNSGYSNHLAICKNTERPKLKCDLCGKEFLTKINLLNHRGAVHGITDHLIFKCSFENCTRSYAKKSFLVDHEIMHKPPEHQCQICGEKFYRSQALKRHMLQQHESQKPFQCEFCARRFARKDNLLSHKRNVHGQVEERRQRKYFKCSECEWKTQVKIGMMGHLEKVHGGVGQFTEVYIWDGSEEINQTKKGKDEKFKCDQCVRKFSSDDQLRKHKARAHSIVKCSKCDWTGGSKRSRLAHMKAAHPDLGSNDVKQKEIYKCEHCGKNFKNSVKLLQHISNIHGNTNGYKCSFENCDKSFPNKTRLRIHENSHKAPRHRCELCGNVYSQKRSLRAHVKRTHQSTDGNEGTDLHIKSDVRKPPRQRGKSCDLCNLTFPTRKGFNMHLEAEHGIKKSETEENTCQICGKKFSSKTVLATHVEQVHEKKYQVCCDLCGKILATRHYLEMHQARVHNIGSAILTRFACSVEGCSKAFENEGKLKRHIRITHEGERPFQCEECGKRFACPKHLRNHNHAMHLNRESKPFKCEVCGKGFAVKNYVWLHMKTHKKKSSDLVQL